MVNEVDVPRESGRLQSRWTPTRWLAVCAVPLLGYQLWTILGWLFDGPYQVVAFRDAGTPSWYAARVAELLVVVVMAGYLWKAVRDRRRLGRLNTDALLVIGVLTSAFWDPIYNWLTPAWMYSSNFLNVNDWFAHAPGIVNPDAGSMPWPIFIVLVGYPVWCVGFAAVVNVAMSWVARRWPTAHPLILVGAAFVVSGAITVVSFSIFQVFDLMNAPGYRLGILGNSQSVFFFYSGGLVFGGLACLRYFRDGAGRSLVERDGNGVVRVLASIAACQLIVVVGWGLLTVPFSLKPSPYPTLPGHLVNGLCDAPGIHGTAYGPCPGSPGFEMPRK